jgi:hypothetical protein
MQKAAWCGSRIDLAGGSGPIGCLNLHIGVVGNFRQIAQKNAALGRASRVLIKFNNLLKSMKSLASDVLPFILRSQHSQFLPNRH